MKINDNTSTSSAQAHDDNNYKARPIEIVLGNKNVAEQGSQQINITQNNFDAETLKEVLKGLSGFSCSDSEGDGKSEGDGDSESETPETLKPETLKPETLKPSAKRGRKKKEKRDRDIEDVFTYKWLNDRSGQARIVRLYQYLKHTSVGWLDPDASMEDWCALFMGEPRPFKLKWIGTQQHLKHLFRLLLEREYISRTNTSVGPWEIVGSHFKDKNQRPFTDWDSQHPAKRKAEVLSWLADFLNVAADMPKEITDEEFIEDEFADYADHEYNNPRKPKFVDIDDMARQEWEDD